MSLSAASWYQRSRMSRAVVMSSMNVAVFNKHVVYVAGSPRRSKPGSRLLLKIDGLHFTCIVCHKFNSFVTLETTRDTSKITTRIITVNCCVKVYFIIMSHSRLISNDSCNISFLEILSRRRSPQVLFNVSSATQHVQTPTMPSRLPSTR